MSILILSLFLPAAAPHAAPPPIPGVVARQDAPARLQSLLAEYSKTRGEFSARLQAAGKPEEVQRLMREENPLPAFIERFRELAFDAAGTETGVSAWIWVANLCMDNERTDEASEAFDVLVGDHLGSPQWGEVAGNLRYNAARLGSARAQEVLAKVLACSPHANVRAAAQFSLAAILLESASPDDKARGRALMEEIPAKYAGVEGDWGERAKGMLFELDRLQIGMLAPDFEAVDADGVTWKLSDYRGKVVIVDFWGFW
jgi:hypothetical protein